jgi:hypothetical protein
MLLCYAHRKEAKIAGGNRRAVVTTNVCLTLPPTILTIAMGVPSGSHQITRDDCSTLDDITMSTDMFRVAS